jgi:putative ABC transport system permease protein
MCSWLIALVIGIPIAYAFVLLLSHLFIPLPFAFHGEDILIMLGFILLVSILSSIGPALGATRIRIIQTLHYE